MEMKLGTTTIDLNEIYRVSSPGYVLDQFEHEAFLLDRSYFGLSTSVSSNFHQSRSRWDYDFTGSNFEWRAIATQGTGNGGWFVPVRAKTEAARLLFKERNDILQTLFPRFDIQAMIHSKNRFFELINILWDVWRWYGSGCNQWTRNVGWLHWNGDEWMKRFATVNLCSWRLAHEEPDIGEIADRCGTIPRLESLQGLVRAGMCL